MRLLRARCDAGASVLMATHDSAHAAWADRVVFLRDGALIDETRPLSFTTRVAEAEPADAQTADDGAPESRR
jgi:ABC-type lipoprotein export system ATPase subunit